ncbi:unnamed protein product [Prunus armeniaca]|uniref:Uncharacterized protein n=1 Tax=Prunus armeniaca TaxID=36596 RepID=A0A6J5VAE8_PRUAR|nr:unnamed protein product [Prunus armeniaca]
MEYMNSLKNYKKSGVPKDAGTDLEDSPHIQTIREHISLGRFGEPVSAKALSSLFRRIKKILDLAVEVENGFMSHFGLERVFEFTK